MPIMRNIILNKVLFPELSSVVVEISSAEDAVGWDAILKEMATLGFKAYAVENDYSYAAYLKWKKAARLLPLHELPAEQTDVLFTTENVSHMI